MYRCLGPLMTCDPQIIQPQRWVWPSPLVAVAAAAVATSRTEDNSKCTGDERGGADRQTGRRTAWPSLVWRGASPLFTQVFFCLFYCCFFFLFSKGGFWILKNAQLIFKVRFSLCV